MESRKSGSLFLIRLSKGEKLKETLAAFCKEKGISAGVFQGIGAVADTTLAFYDLREKQYITKSFQSPMEIASLTGNIASVEGRPFLHAHAVLSDRRMRAFGGHLQEATVWATCEIALTPLPATLKRKRDKKTGLNLWDLRT